MYAPPYRHSWRALYPEYADPAIQQLEPGFADCVEQFGLVTRESVLHRAGGRLAPVPGKFDVRRAGGRHKWPARNA
jgi:hypothetical protein